MKLRITTVDMDGYCGREFHPSRSDEGLIVTPIKMESYFGDDMNPVLNTASVSLATDEVSGVVFSSQDVDQICYVWTVLTADNRILELIDHEVEIV